MTGLKKMAPFYGYDCQTVEKKPSPEKNPSQKISVRSSSEKIWDHESGVNPEPVDETFYYVTKHRSVATHESKTISPDWFKNSKAFTEQIRADLNAAPPPRLPLVPWARLWPFLRVALGGSYPGRQLDVDKLVNQIARGQSLCRLSYRPRKSWVFRCQIIIDYNPRLLPFFDDLIVYVNSYWTCVVDKDWIL